MPIPGSRSLSIKRSLRLSIDPSPYRKSSDISTASESPSASTRSTTSPPTSESDDWVIFSVLCLHDFESTEEDHLAFRQNEILDVVRQEPSGWWAALRPNGPQVGWIPSSFVQPLSEDMAEKLRPMREELRLFEYDAERLYNSAPITNYNYLYERQRSPSPERWSTAGEGERASQLGTPTELVGHGFPSSNSRESSSELYLQAFTSAGDSHRHRSSASPAAPLPKVPPPSTKAGTLHLNKPTPPTPKRGTTFDNIPSSYSFQSQSLLDNSSELSRSRSESATGFFNGGRTVRSRPVLVDDHASPSRLSTLMEGNHVKDLTVLTTPDRNAGFELPRVPAPGGGVRQKENSIDEEEVQNAKLTQAHLPWYLRPAYTSQDIKVGFDGSVKAGTLDALVERLTADPYKPAPDAAFRNAFLMTYRTFTTGMEVFDRLVERYQMDLSTHLNAEEFENWKEIKLRPCQQRVLTTFTIWFEDHNLLREEPQVAEKLKEFLSLIVSPAPLAITARLMRESLDRMASGRPLSSPPSAVSPHRRRKSKAHRNDLLRLDPTDIAEQLCLYEHKLYAKITPQECLNWSKVQTGKTVVNLFLFCATHDKLGAWVKTSILSNEVLNKRTDTLDFWIKVAEKCRNLNNFSSMSAIVTALSSAVIARLHLTWVNASRRSQFEQISKYNDPTSGFAAYRQLLQEVDGPCVPFIPMFLTNIVHIADQLQDMVPPNPDRPDAKPLIFFTKRQRWYDIISTMLRHQRHFYIIPDNDSSRIFIESHLRTANTKDQGWYWQRSKEVQHLELAHADIRKGLEAAGF
ncbi:hypothetical protein PLICRDRAFT_50030 [Plicaturopsis crispa FD-325 SS-3]|nr:hypothetical protein PLICRDRAFT_50030 [Plicaturopsis crispa FD-325 SS-3]